MPPNQESETGQRSRGGRLPILESSPRNQHRMPRRPDGKFGLGPPALAIPAARGRDAMTALQLKRTQSIETGLTKLLQARCAVAAPLIEEDWQPLLLSAIGKKADLNDRRSKKA
jgi:hypothetical protein